MVEAVLGLLGTLLYPLFSIIFVLLSILQGLFYSFAGIGTVYYGGAGFSGMKDEITGSNPSGGKTDTGLLYYILNSDIVKNILISMMILALFLLIIFTTLAFIKTIYAEKPKSWRDIVSSAVKGLVNFIVLPVCCLLGVWVGNIILQAVNGATSTGGTVFLDRKLFLSCAYNANTYRVNSFEAGSAKSENAYNTIIATIDAYNDPVLNAMRSQIKQGQDSDYYANVVDQMYATDRIGIHNHITVGIGVTPKHGYYQLWSINYLLLIVGGVFMLYVMINVTYGMIKRLFILMMLFVVSPALCAMYPLDDGNAVKSWTGDVRKNILSAYGAVAGMNLLFSFLPIIQNINIASSMFGAWAANVLFLSDIIQLILMVCAMFCMNDFISMISGYIGAGNAFSDGKSLRSSAKGALKKYGKPTAKMTVGSFVRGVNSQKNGGGFWRGVGSSWADQVLGEKDDKGKRKGGLLKSGMGLVGEVWDDAAKEAKAGSDNAKHKKTLEKWKSIIANLSDDDISNPAMMAELQRQMTADKIKDYEMFDKNLGLFGDESRFGKKDAVLDNIAQFGEKDWHAKEADLLAARDSIDLAKGGSSAAAVVTRRERSVDDQRNSGTTSTGTTYISSVESVNAAQASVNAAQSDVTAAMAAETTARNDLSTFDLTGLLSNEQKTSRIAMGLKGMFTEDEMKARSSDPATVDKMLEFNKRLEAVARAQEELAEANKKLTDATTKKIDEEHKSAEALKEFTAKLTEAKSISKDAEDEINKFGSAVGKTKTEIEKLMKAISDAVDNKYGTKKP